MDLSLRQVGSVLQGRVSQAKRSPGGLRTEVDHDLTEGQDFRKVPTGQAAAVSDAIRYCVTQDQVERAFCISGSNLEQLERPIVGSSGGADAKRRVFD
jgi:hypothetical protein